MEEFSPVGTPLDRLRATLAHYRNNEALTPTRAEYLEHVGLLLDYIQANTRCSECGQTDRGQQGEYPCPKCGLPTLWDREPPESLRDKRMRLEREIVPEAPADLDGLPSEAYWTQ